MTSLIHAPQALSYGLPIGQEPINRLVSEILSIRVADRHTDRHVDTLSDNKDCLKLSIDCLCQMTCSMLTLTLPIDQSTCAGRMCCHVLRVYRGAAVVDGQRRPV